MLRCSWLCDMMPSTTPIMCLGLHNSMEAACCLQSVALSFSVLMLSVWQQECYPNYGEHCRNNSHRFTLEDGPKLEWRQKMYVTWRCELSRGWAVKTKFNSPMLLCSVSGGTGDRATLSRRKSLQKSLRDSFRRLRRRRSEPARRHADDSGSSSTPVTRTV